MSAIGFQLDVAPTGLALIRWFRAIKMSLLRSWSQQARRAGIFVATVVWLRISSVGAAFLWQTRGDRPLNVAPLGLALIRWLRAINMPLRRSWLDTRALHQIALSSLVVVELRNSDSLRFCFEARMLGHFSK